MTDSAITQIKKIKEKLDIQKLSVLVGAGFSINVSKEKHILIISNKT